MPWPATLTRDDLRTLTPSVFAATPWKGIAPPYRFIPTADVLDLLEDQGFRSHPPTEPDANSRQSRVHPPHAPAAS